MIPIETNGSKNEYIGEVVSASVNQGVIQLWDCRTIIPFGTLITVVHDTYRVCGIIYQVSTQTQDDAKTVFTYKKNIDALIREQPQIFSLLKTTLMFIPVVCMFASNNRQNDSFIACNVHAPVRISNAEDAEQVFQSELVCMDHVFDSGNGICNIDFLLATFLKRYIVKERPQYVDKFVTWYSSRIGRDYIRLRRFIQNVMH